MSLPSGTLTFLFTDVEGSTRLWERDAGLMRAALSAHDRILTQTFKGNGGTVFKKMGDAVYAVFDDAASAVAAAFKGQLELTKALSGKPDSKLPVRMALYTGTAHATHGDYVGTTLNRTARVLSTGHGGQILISQTTHDLLLDALPPGASIIDLGSHYLKDLERPEQIYQLHHPDLRAEFPPLRSLSAFRHNLPIQLTGLIGRAEEVRVVRELLDGHRLVTLYGSGGCGKTRMALQVGAEEVDAFPDGVWLVELSNAADSVQAEQALVSALGLREEGGRDTGQVIMEHLRDRRTLLILDNCEHLVEASAAQAQELLQGCPNVKVLTTSREVLGVRGEVTYRVPSLPVPDAIQNVAGADLPALRAADSVRLFIERAEEAAPGFTLSPGNASHLVEVTRRLDGIPLAIELAAARVRTLTVEQISERLRDHFSLLRTTGPVPPRHATLRATMDWSYLLLDPLEQALLARLTVFAGGWTLESAEAVCVAGISGRLEPEPFEIEDVADLLSRLEDKSLIAVDRTTDSARYRMLQMVREYASEHLTHEESEASGLRHLEYFVGTAEEAEVNLSGPNQGEWLKRLDSEHDNLRIGLETAKRNPDLADAGLRLAGSLARFWHIRGILSEGRRHLAALLSLAGKPRVTTGWGLAFNGAGILAWAQSDLNAAESDFRAAQTVWEGLKDDRRLAGALSNLALVYIDRGCYPVAQSLLERSIEIRRRIGDESGCALSTYNLGLLAYSDGRLDEARVKLSEAVSQLEALGDRAVLAGALNNLGTVAYALGHLDEAVSWFKCALPMFAEIDDRSGEAWCLFNLGDTALRAGRLQDAADFYSASMSIATDLDHTWSGHAAIASRRGDLALSEGSVEKAAELYLNALETAIDRQVLEVIPSSLVGLALVAKKRRRFELSASCYGVARSCQEGIVTAPGAVWDRPGASEELAELRRILGEERYSRAFQFGHMLSPVSFVNDPKLERELKELTRQAKNTHSL